MATPDEVKSKLKQRLSRYKEQTPTRIAYLGDGRGNATSNMVPVGEPSKFWARESLDGDKPFKITNKNPNLTPAFNLPVLLGYPEHDPTEEQVLGLHSALIKLDAGGNVSGSSIGGAPPHHQKHEWGGGDTVYVDPRMFKPGLVAPTAPVSMKVKVLAFQHYYNFWRRYDGGTSPDLTQYIPSSDYRYVMLTLDPDTNQLVVHPGSVFSPDLSIDSIISNQATNTFRHIPVPPGNEIPLGVVLLESTTTKVDWNPEGVNNLMPMRILLSSPMKEINERVSLLETATGVNSLPQTGAANSVENDLLPGRIDGNITRLVLNRSSASANLPTLFVGELGYSNSTPSALVIGTASGNKLLPFSSSGGGGGASVLGDLEDVSIGTLNYYNVLAWDYSASMWKPASQIYVPELIILPESGDDIARFSEADTVLFCEYRPVIISGLDNDLQRWGGKLGGEMLVQINPNTADMRQEWLYANGSVAAEYYSEFDTLNYFRFSTQNSPSALEIKYDDNHIRFNNDDGTSALLYLDTTDNHIVFGSATSFLADGSFEIHSPSHTRLNNVGHFNHYTNTLNRATSQEYYFKNESGSLVPYVSQSFATVAASYAVYSVTALSAGTAIPSLFKVDTSVGEVVVNDGNTDLGFRAEGSAANYTNLFKVDAKLNAVQIGTSVAGQIADFREHLIELNKNKNQTTTTIWGSYSEPLFHTDVINNRVGIGTNAPSGARLQVLGGVSIDSATFDSKTTVVTYNVSNSAADNPVNFDWNFPDLSTQLGRIRLFRSTNTTGTLEMVIYRGNNTATVDHQFRANGGYLCGNATGGDKGVGTINISGNIYKNNTAYTNPDYALEYWATGKIARFKDNPGAQGYHRLSVEESKEYAKKNFRLPRITDEPAGIFDMADIALEKIEEAHIYIYELHDRIKALEQKIEELCQKQ